MKPPLLVNAWHPLPAGYAPGGLSPALPGSQMLLESGCAAALAALVKSAGGEGRIVAVSGYRPHSEQLALWEEVLRDKGEAFTRRYVALPGCSEHETICAEFRAKAAEFGFIERYQAGKEPVTGIAAEPWHFRYVGAEHARRIAALGLALEEYVLQFNRRSPE